MGANNRLSRRDLLEAAGKTALAAGFLGPAIIGQAKNRKPNILFLWTDEQRADTMPVYGNDAIQTPNLHQLSRESVVFERAYVSQPVCTPSRTTVLTGRWPHETPCITNNIPLPRELPCLPELLDDSDYRTGYFGKWHLGDEVFSQHGFEEWISIEDGYRKYYGEGRDPSAKSLYFQFLQELGYEPDTDAGYYSRGFAARRPLEHCKPRFLETKVCDFLRRHRDDPFIAHVNFLEPHMPFYGPLDDLHHPDKIALPANYDDPLEDDEPLSYRARREYFRNRGFDGQDLKTEQGWRRLIANYWGLCSQVDRSVGGILETLEKEGLADNTIVVYTSDHGDMMGSHQMIAKTVMYEESARVPWLIRIPQQGLRQQIITQPVSHIDLVPTLLDLVGKPMNDALPGKSLSGLMKGTETLNDVFIEWHPGGWDPSAYQDVMKTASRENLERAMATNTRTVVSTDRWKLCLNDQDKNQLFNLNDDPGETTNLFYTGQHKSRISDLTRRIHRWQESVEDTVSV